MSSQVVGVFGGSFNPPHVGHVLAVTYVLSCTGIDRCLIVPTYQHPFAKTLVDFDHRVAMCQRAFAPLGAEVESASDDDTLERSTARVVVSTVERRLGGDSLTVRTLEHLVQAHPTWRFRLIVGTDLVHDFPKWSQPDRIQELAPLLVVGRAGVATPTGFSDLPHVLPAISSTDIRTALRSGTSVDALVPREVLTYVEQHGLYVAG